MTDEVSSFGAENVYLTKFKIQIEIQRIIIKPGSGARAIIRAGARVQGLSASVGVPHACFVVRIC